jgi:hypothetical protein
LVGCVGGEKMSNTAMTTETKSNRQTFGRGSSSPGAYRLNLSAVKDIAVTLNGQPSTFVEAYCKLRDSKVKEVPTPFPSGEKYITEEEIIEFDCDWPVSATMRELVGFMREGIDPHGVIWFYYAHDWSRDADEIQTFFVVHDGKIIRESCNFGSAEPLVLKRETDDDPIWRSHEYFNEAFERYWYRRFYTETLTGQLMVLRPDEPILYHYERPAARDIAQQIRSVTLLKMYRLLWVALPLLVAVAFPLTRPYMAIAASVLGVELLRLCWITRKLGKP